MSWTVEFNSVPVLFAEVVDPASPGHTASSTASTAEHGDRGGEHEVSQWVFFGYSLLAFLLIALLAVLGTRRMRLVPQGLQNFWEWIFESLYGIPEMVMGPRGRQFGPLIATFFLYIVVMNLTGLIPGLKSGTASLSVTLGLAVVAFVAVQYYGFQAHGLQYLLHFLGPVPAMAILIMPLELIAELVRVVSLSIRLYGNINGEEQVIQALATQLHWTVAVLLLPIQLLTIFLQAFVFCLLVAVYISLATEKHGADHDDAHEASAY